MQQQIVIPKPAGSTTFFDVSLTIQATMDQLKTLFRLRDDVQALFESILLTEVQTAETIAVASEFYLNFLRSVETAREAFKDFAVEAGDFPLVTKAHGDLQCMGDIFPIRIKLQVGEEMKTQIQENLSALSKFLKQKYRDHTSQIDMYFVLLEVFRFIVHMKKDVIKFFDPNKTTVPTSSEYPCVCCGEPTTEFFDHLQCCLKCRRFFLKVMSTKKVPRCRNKDKPNTKCVENGRVDISCQKCRYEECMKLGMFDAYKNIDKVTPRPSDGSRPSPFPPHLCCSICKLATAVHPFLGVLICKPCESFFNESIVAERFKTYECSHNNLCDLSAQLQITNEMCKKCWFKKMTEFGLVRRYLDKEKEKLDEKVVKHLQTTKVNDFHCDICNSGMRRKNLWFGLKVCETCRSFLDSTLENGLQDVYFCSQGFQGTYCGIRAQDSDKAGRCKFCWFKKMEEENLVLRWNMADGSSAKWYRDLHLYKMEIKDPVLRITKLELQEITDLEKFGLKRKNLEDAFKIITDGAKKRKEAVKDETEKTMETE